MPPESAADVPEHLEQLGRRSDTDLDTYDPGTKSKTTLGPTIRCWEPNSYCASCGRVNFCYSKTLRFALVSVRSFTENLLFNLPASTAALENCNTTPQRIRVGNAK